MRITHTRHHTTFQLPSGYALARAAAATVTLTAVVLATAGAAQADHVGQEPPAFLAAEDLPPRSSGGWYAGDVTEGLPDITPFCAEGVELSDEQASHRLFTTDLDTGASQVSLVSDDTESATALASELRESMAGCAADWLRDNPGGTASWRDLGEQDVGDGAHTYGVHIASAHGSQDVHLVAVGRAGDTVTVVNWGEMGTFDNAPVTEYRQTVRTAVEKLVD